MIYKPVVWGVNDIKMRVTPIHYERKRAYLLGGIYLLKVSNRNARKRCEIYSKLTIKIPERRH